MSFELYCKGYVKLVPSGKALIRKSGKVRFSGIDLGHVHIGPEVVVEIDRDHRMIGIRAPYPKESAESIRAVWNKSHTSATVYLSGVLKLFGEDPRPATVETFVKDKLLVIPLGTEKKR